MSTAPENRDYTIQFPRIAEGETLPQWLLRIDSASANAVSRDLTPTEFEVSRRAAFVGQYEIIYETFRLIGDGVDDVRLLAGMLTSGYLALKRGRSALDFRLAAEHAIAESPERIEALVAALGSRADREVADAPDDNARVVVLRDAIDALEGLVHGLRGHASGAKAQPTVDSVWMKLTSALAADEARIADAEHRTAPVWTPPATLTPADVTPLPTFGGFLSTALEEFARGTEPPDAA